jgi:hypothetical protein
MGNSHDGEAYRLLVEAKTALFPRDACEAIWQLRNDLVHNDVGYQRESMTGIRSQ